MRDATESAERIRRKAGGRLAQPNLVEATMTGYDACVLREGS